MKTIDKKHWHVRFDRTLAPAATVSAGEEVRFETMDACFGEVHSVAEFLAYRERPFRGGDPMTGPVYVVGAAPGDTLVVDILDIELTGIGFQLVGPSRAMVTDEITEWTCHEVHPRGDRIWLSNGMEFDAAPIIGCFGNAPDGPSMFQFTNPLGGNCDVPWVRAGAHLYLPIEVPGALFSLGDVHARQGDGEVVGAPEIGACVTVRVGLQAGRQADGFMIEDQTHWHSPHAGKTEYEAIKAAVFQNAHFISRQHDVQLADALVGLTMLGSISICCTGTWASDAVVTVCSSFPKAEMRDAMQNVVHG
jgi:amidase